MSTLKIENKQETVICAGIIPISYTGRKVLMVRHPEGHWGFPKGHVEFDETEITAAKRELFEETGIYLNFVLDTEKYKYTIVYLCKENGKIIRKKVTFFLGITCTTDVVLNPNFKEYKWISLEDLDKMDLFEQYKQLLIKISPLIHKDICLVNSSKINVENLSHYQGIGSKHAFSRIAPLKLLHSNLRIQNEPNILDTYFINEIIKSNNYDSNGYFVIYEDEMSKCWSIMNMLPLLVYKHKKLIMKGRPNGCNIGSRPIELYLTIMETLGIDVKVLDDSYFFEYKGINEDIFIELPFPSFSGTSMACCLALLNTGETCITNVSIEPEIIFLVNSIEQLGYTIILSKENRFIKIIGNPNLKIENTTITIPEDRNILVTRIVSSLLEKQKLHFVANYGLDFDVLSNFFEQINLKFYLNNNYIIINDYEDLFRNDKSIDVYSGFYPKICSDWQPMISLFLLTYCKSFNIFDEVFENRYEYMKQLKSLLNGFEYQYNRESLHVEVSKSVTVKDDAVLNLKFLDIRAAATLCLALNHWKVNNFCIENLDQFFRGYSSISDFSKEFETRCKYVFKDS